MDLLKAMRANREASGLTQQVEKMAVTKSSNKSEIAPGTKTMRKHIIDEKPGKKVVKTHIEAIIAHECESSSEEE